MAIFATFQNLVIFRILGVFSSRFLHRTTLMCFQSPFCYDFGLFKFRPKIGHFPLLQPMQYGHFCHFSNSCFFSNIRQFFEPFSAQNNFNVFLKSFLLRFWHFSSPCKIAVFATFQNLVIFRILGVFSSRFLHRTTLMCFQSPFCYDFGTFKFRPKIGHFALLQPMQYGHFCHFSKSCHFSNIRRFSSHFLHRTTLMCFQSPFCYDFGTFKFRPKIGHFSLLQPMQYGRFCHFSKSCHFSNIRRFFEPFSAQNNFNVFLESILLRFWHF